MVIYPPFRVIFNKLGHEPRLLALVFFTRGKVDWSSAGAEDHTGWPVGTKRVWEMLVHVEFPVGTSPRAHGGGCEGITTPKCPQIPWDGGNYPKWGEEEAILYDFVHRAWWKMIPFDKKSPWQACTIVCPLKTSRKKSWVDHDFEEMFHPD